MKRSLLPCIIVFISLQLSAQNVGIGKTSPSEKLDVTGNFRVTASYTEGVNPPTAAQTYTMINGSTLTMGVDDSTTRVYDPGGPSGNYIANLSSNFLVHGSGSYLELLIETINLGTGDSLIVHD